MICYFYHINKKKYKHRISYFVLYNLCTLSTVKSLIVILARKPTTVKIKKKVNIRMLNGISFHFRFLVLIVFSTRRNNYKKARKSNISASPLSSNPSKKPLRNGSSRRKG